MREQTNIKSGAWAALRVMLGAAVLALVFGCGAAATPTPTPTTIPLRVPTPTATVAAPQPAATAAAPQPAATAAAPQPVPTATPRPAPTATPAKPAKSTLTAVFNDEPPDQSVLARNTTTGQMLSDSLSDTLTVFNYDTFEVMPFLATKWELVEPNRWRYTLRQGLKFQDDSPFNAETAASTISGYGVVENGFRNMRYFGDGVKGEAHSLYELDIVTANPDPVGPKNATHTEFDSGKHMAESTFEELIQTSVGLGPYMLSEWKRGEYIKHEYWPGYWGPEPEIKEVTVVWRGEDPVRAAMVATGEAEWAWDIGFVNADRVPRWASIESVETQALKVDARWNPATSNQKVRQAMIYAIDREAITRDILKGTTAPRYMPFHSGATGYTTEAELYKYDPDKARQLLAEAGYAGQEIILTSRIEYAADEDTLTAVIEFWREVGINSKLNIIEAGRWRDHWGAGGLAREVTTPPSVRTDVIMFGHTNDTFDASATLGYATCTGYYGSFTCHPDAAWEQRVWDARATFPPDRDAALENIMKAFMDYVILIPLYDIRPVYGMAKNLQWTPNPNWRLRWDTMVFRD